MKRESRIFLVLLFLSIFLAACSSDESASGGSSSLLEVEIDEAQYILSGDSGSTSEEDKGLLAVTLDITNKSEQSVDVSPYDGIVLYDEGEQKSPQTDVYNANVDLGDTDFGDIGPERTKKVSAIFYVENDKEYEIGIKPFVVDPDTDPEEVLLPINTADYADGFDQLEDPADALVAIVDTIYFDQENPDYEKLVSEDKEALQDDAKSLFEDQMDMIFSRGVPDEELDKNYDLYKSLLAEKAEITAETTANANDKAVVQIDYETLPLDVYDDVRDYTKEYRENTDDWDTENAEEYALENFEKVLDSIEPQSNRNQLEVLMTREEGKWSVDMSDYNGERLAEAFAAGKR